MQLFLLYNYYIIFYYSMRFLSQTVKSKQNMRFFNASKRQSEVDKNEKI